MTHGSLSGQRRSRSASYVIGNIYEICYVIKPQDTAGLLSNCTGGSKL